MTGIGGRKINVLILENEFGMGGSEKKLYDFIARVDGSRFAIKVCCLKQGGYFKSRLQDRGVPFHDGLLRHKFDVFAFRKLARILREEQIDLIYTFAHRNTVIFSYAAKVLAKVRAFLVSFHATGNPEGGRLIPSYLKPFLDEAGVFLAVAHSQKRYLVEVEGLPETRIEVIQNGVDTAKYRPQIGARQLHVRQEFDLDPESTVITTIASLKPAKQIDVLLESCARVLQTAGHVRVLLVGDGPDKENLESLAVRLGIGEKVVFAGIRDDVDEILRESDALVLPSRPGTETFPNVLLEAMATGLPVITTDVGSVREMVEHGRSAFIVPSGDVDALSRAIATIAGDRQLARRFGERGRQIVEQNFRLEQMCEKRERLFERLFSTPSH